MRIIHLVLLLVFFSFGAAAAKPDVETPKITQADYRTMPSLLKYLPLNIPEIAEMNRNEKQELGCLAWNIYFEARGEPKIEQIAVAWVPMNRTGHKDFGESICQTVFQFMQHLGHKRFHFDWAARALYPKWNIDEKSWSKAQKLALEVYRKQIPDITHGAIYFQRYDIAQWSKAPKIRIGSQVFW